MRRRTNCCGFGDLWDRSTFDDFKSIIGMTSAARCRGCLLYTSDAADERSSVDLGGRRIIKKKTRKSTNVSIAQYAKTANDE